MAADKVALGRSSANGRRSACITYNDTLYTSGIVATDFSGDIHAQSVDIFAQLDRLMAVYDTQKHNMISATIYLANMDDYANFNTVWDEWIDSGFEPCRSLVQAGFPSPACRVKIAVVAAIPD